MGIRIYIFTIILCGYYIPNTSTAQPQLEWIARYNGPSNGNEMSYAMALDSNGNIFVTGTDEEWPPGIITIKYNSSGQLMWATRYAGMQSFAAQPIKIGTDLQGNVYVAAT